MFYKHEIYLPIHGIYFLLSHFLARAVTITICPISAQQKTHPVLNVSVIDNYN